MGSTRHIKVHDFEGKNKFIRLGKEDMRVQASHYKQPRGTEAPKTALQLTGPKVSGTRARGANARLLVCQEKNVAAAIAFTKLCLLAGNMKDLKKLI